MTHLSWHIYGTSLQKMAQGGMLQLLAELSGRVQNGPYSAKLVCTHTMLSKLLHLFRERVPSSGGAQSGSSLAIGFTIGRR